MEEDSKAHTSNDGLDEWFKCSKCPKHYRNPQSAARHYREKHQDSYQKLRCANCGQQFSRRFSLELHVRKRCKGRLRNSQTSSNGTDSDTTPMTAGSSEESSVAGQKDLLPPKRTTKPKRKMNKACYHAYEYISKAFDEVADYNDSANPYKTWNDCIAMTMWRELMHELRGWMLTNSEKLEAIFLGSVRESTVPRFSLAFGSKTLTGMQSIVLLLSLSPDGQEQWVREFCCTHELYAKLCNGFFQNAERVFPTHEEVESILDEIECEHTCKLIDHTTTSYASHASMGNTTRAPGITDTVRRQTCSPGTTKTTTADMDWLDLPTAMEWASGLARENHAQHLSWYSDFAGIPLTRGQVSGFDGSMKRPPGSLMKGSQRRTSNSQVICLVQSFQRTHEKLATAFASRSAARLPHAIIDLLGTHATSDRQAKNDGFEAVKALFEGRLPSPRDLRGVLGLAQVASAMRDVIINSGLSSDSELASREKFLNDLGWLTHLLHEDLQAAYQSCILVMWDKCDWPPTTWLDDSSERDSLLVYFQELFGNFQVVSGMGCSSQYSRPSPVIALQTHPCSGTGVNSAQCASRALDLQSRGSLIQVMFLATGAIFGLLLAFIILWRK
jgi:uncharacterized C2H2 Zn-finger protein